MRDLLEGVFVITVALVTGGMVLCAGALVLRGVIWFCTKVFA